jgi:hypothetical protein
MYKIGIFESIYFCNLNLSEKEQLEYISKPKSVICREIGANVLIDDCLDHALDCAQQYGHMDILLYDRNGSYKWNHTNNNSQTQLKRVFKSVIGYNYPCRNDTPYNNVQRVFSWRDIITQFPKPTSPLRNCHYPNEFILPDLVTSEEEEELEEEDELLLLEASNEHNNYFGYETVELEELTDDESPWNDSTVWM